MITKAKPQDADIISELAMRSKAYWGYSKQFMKAVREELTYCHQSIRKNPTFKSLKGQKIMGFYQLIHVSQSVVELEALFVEPGFIGLGVGRQLFSHAVTQASQLGYKNISIQADPFAEDFYVRLGCIKVGEKPSLSVPGRTLPLMEFSLG